jgi:hypothetical protein
MARIEANLLQKIENVSLGPDGRVLHHANIVAPEWAREKVGARMHVNIWFDPAEKRVLVVEIPDLLPNP